MEQKTRTEIGKEGEELAAGYLREKGYRILDRNVRLKYGELDIVAEKGGELVFVEVKTRRSSFFGAPEESVTRKKQGKLISLAFGYLKGRQLEGKPFHFDVVTVTFQNGPVIHHLENAFDGSGF